MEKKGLVKLIISATIGSSVLFLNSCSVTYRPAYERRYIPYPYRSTHYFSESPFFIIHSRPPEYNKPCFHENYYQRATPRQHRTFPYSSHHQSMRKPSTPQKTTPSIHQRTNSQTSQRTTPSIHQRTNSQTSQRTIRPNSQTHNPQKSSDSSKTLRQSQIRNLNRSFGRTIKK